MWLTNDTAPTPAAPVAAAAAPAASASNEVSHSPIYSHLLESLRVWLLFYVDIVFKWDDGRGV